MSSLLTGGSKMTLK
jgi:hypothetical protein